MIVTIPAIRRLAAYELRLGEDKLRNNGPNNTGCNAILKFENILQRAVEFVRPNMIARCCFDQLSSHPHAVACLADAPFQHVVDTKLLSNPLYVNRLALVRKRGIAGDHEERLDRGRAVIMSSTIPSAKYS